MNRIEPQLQTASTQRGDFLIESLVGVLLMGIVATGIGHVAKQASSNQGELQDQVRVTNHLNQLIISGDASRLCSSETKTIATTHFSEGATISTSQACDGLSFRQMSLSFTPPGGETTEISSTAPITLSATIRAAGSDTGNSIEVFAGTSTN